MQLHAIEWDTTSTSSGGDKKIPDKITKTKNILASRVRNVSKLVNAQ
jgi:hypothetical protein